MKKAIALILALLLALTACAETAFSTYSDDDLVALLNAIRQELAQRDSIAKAEDGTVLIDQDGVKLYISGEPYDTHGIWDKVRIPCVLVNDTDHNIRLQAFSAAVNGWEADMDDETCGAGRKAKIELSFDLSKTDCETLDDITDVQVTFKIIDKDHWTTLFLTDDVFIALK